MASNITTKQFTNRVEASVVGLSGGKILAVALDRYSKVAPWVRPVWLGPDAFFLLACSILLGLGWGVVELVFARDRAMVALRSLLTQQLDRSTE